MKHHYSVSRVVVQGGAHRESYNRYFIRREDSCFFNYIYYYTYYKMVEASSLDNS